MPTLQFKGKTFVLNHHLAVRYHQLIPRQDRSLTDRHSLQNDNLIIQGDNLLALKALLPTYAGRVKCIYIDPPYNTGNEGWAYNDNVNAPMFREWLGQTVDRDDLTRHDKWCCMMYPRLKLLHELLSEDGAIFVSIDDNEQHRLRMMMDEIWGEGNFINNIIWQKKYSPQNDAKYFSDMHDFIVCYAKNKNTQERKNGWVRKLLKRTEEMNERYSNPDNDPRGDWKTADPSVKSYTEDYDYPVKTPSGKIVYPPEGRCWMTSEENFKALIKDNRIWFGKNGSNSPALKKFLTEVKQGIVPVTIWFYEDVGHNQQAKQEIKKILSGAELNFDTPKPVMLIKRILEIATDEDSLVLDSFAGSGTTAQAVLELNREDGGNRRFILVEMEGYADKITAERVRRVVRGVPEAKKEALREGLGGTFSYFELGEEIYWEQMVGRSAGLPGYDELARFVFFTATGEQLDLAGLRPEGYFAGESLRHVVYLWYRPDHAWLRNTAFTLADAEALPAAPPGKRRLVFAPMKYVDWETLDDLNIDFVQLPWEIYRMK